MSDDITEKEIEIARKMLEVEELIADVRTFVNERTKDWTPAQKTHFIALQYVQITKAVLYA